MLTKHLDFNIIFIGQEKTGTFYYIIDLYSKMQMDESTKLCDIKYKIVFLGDSAVGKSALIERFIKERFDDNKVETVGIDFMVKNVFFEGVVYRLQLWDTAGQEKFKSLVPNYIRDAHCAVFVYDVSRKQTLEAIKGWLKLFQDTRSDDAVSILVGNKVDLKLQRRIEFSQGQQFAEKHCLSFCQTSAKSSEGVEQLFHSIIQNIRIGGSNTKLSEKLDQDKQNDLKNSSRSESRINKAKMVKISKEKKTSPCCYI